MPRSQSDCRYTRFNRPYAVWLGCNVMSKRPVTTTLFNLVCRAASCSTKMPLVLDRGCSTLFYHRLCRRTSMGFKPWERGWFE
jgi:hypothetical protein